MSYLVQAIEETWGTPTPISGLVKFNRYADMKSYIAWHVSDAVNDLRKFGHPHRVRTLNESPDAYEVVIEWCPDGALLPVDWETEDLSAYQDAGLQCSVIISGRVNVNQKSNR